MTTTNHAITGALIATLIKQPLLAIPISFLSHFVCDALPHFGVNFKFGTKGMYRYLFFDGLFALLAAVFLLWQGVNSPVLLAVCGFAAMSPDLFWLYYGVTGKLGVYERYGLVARIHHKIQWSETKIGIVPELIWASICVTLILRFQ